MIKGVLNTFINNLSGVLSSMLTQQRTNIENLAKHDMKANRIALMKVSRLQKYCLILYDNNDLIFLNLNAKCK